MAQLATFPRPQSPTYAGSFSRTAKELTIYQALRDLPTHTAPGPVSYPLGLAMGIFSAHMGYVMAMIVPFGLPVIVVSLLATLILVSGFLALLPGRDRWVLGLAALGAGAGLFLAPHLVNATTLGALTGSLLA